MFYSCKPKVLILCIDTFDEIYKNILSDVLVSRKWILPTNHKGKIDMFC